MRYFIHITKQAEHDMDDAAAYIAYMLLNPQAAYNLLARVRADVAALADFPQRNALVEDSILASCGIRFIVINNYLAFYIISEDNVTVHIIRFLYSKRNWVHILKQGYSFD